jgi:hypothetical protein
MLKLAKGIFPVQLKPADFRGNLSFLDLQPSGFTHRDYEIVKIRQDMAFRLLFAPKLATLADERLWHSPWLIGN